MTRLEVLNCELERLAHTIGALLDDDCLTSYQIQTLNELMAQRAELQKGLWIVWTTDQPLEFP